MLTPDIISFEQLGPDIFLISLQKKYTVGTHHNCPSEALLMSKQIIYFYRKIRKILYGALGTLNL